MPTTSGIPTNNSWVLWTPATNIPASAKNFVLCEGFVPDAPNSKYFLHNNDHEYALLESRYRWYLAIYTANLEQGTTAVTYWAGKEPVGSESGEGAAALCQGNRLQFTQDHHSLEPIGGACASRRMSDATINGRAACVSWSYYPNYALRLAAIVAAGAIAGRVINKKKRKKGTIVGALVGGGVATILALTGALRPSFVYKE